MVLEAAGDDVDDEFEDGIDGGENVVEDQEADDDGLGGVEAEGVVEGGVTDEGGEEGEEPKDVELEGSVSIEIRLVGNGRVKPERFRIAW